MDAVTFVDLLRGAGYRTALVGKAHFQNMLGPPALIRLPPGVGEARRPPSGRYDQEIAAKWEGNRLVTEEKDPRGNKMSRAFELSSDGMQLYETLHMTVGRSNTPLVIRYVYDQASASPPAIQNK